MIRLGNQLMILAITFMTMMSLGRCTFPGAYQKWTTGSQQSPPMETTQEGSINQMDGGDASLTMPHTMQVVEQEQRASNGSEGRRMPGQNGEGSANSILN